MQLARYFPEQQIEEFVALNRLPKSEEREEFPITKLASPP